MSVTPNLSLPYIAAAQAQKHVTHNEAIRALDALVQLAVVSRNLSDPPTTPADGARYIVAAGATADWAGHDGEVAGFQDGAWAFFVPQPGWRVWVNDENALLAWSGGAWVSAGGSGGGGSVNPAPLVGVNTIADTTNRLAVKSDAVLFSHDDVTPGSGDHRVAINKLAGANTATLVFQTAYSGRAEFGIAGDDDFRVKVSANGADWFDGVVIDAATGAVTLPNTAGRELLQADRYYHVDPSGSDSNDGLTSATAFASIQAAVDATKTLDANGYQVIIQVAPGSYDEAITVDQSVVGTDRLVIQGDETTPANVALSTGGVRLFTVTSARVKISGFRVTVGGGNGTAVFAESGADVVLGTMDYGPMATHHMEVITGARVLLDADYTISGGCLRHFRATTGGVIKSTNRTVTVTNGPSFSDFALVQSTGVLEFWQPAFVGSASGRRYRVETNGAVNTFGAGAALFPGDSAGTTNSGGQYA